MTNVRSEPCLQVLFFTLNNQLKAGVHNDNTFNYKYRNWLFGFTLALSLLLPVIMIIDITLYVVNSNNSGNINPITAD